MNALDRTQDGMHDMEHAGDDVSRGNVYRALVRDAFLQVLDNTVFKVLLAIVLLMVALTFVIGFREDGIHVLFGFAVYPYDDVKGILGPLFGAIGGDNINVTVIRGFQGIFTSTIAGKFGALFAVVATSFFLPRMLERGSADTLFSKPVSRGALVLSRYVTSLVFITILTTVLVVGMYLGFAVSSGYTDVRFLWSGPMLVYLFAILSAFSTFWGAFTRSSVATLMLTVISWWACWGVHGGWFVAEYIAYTNTTEQGRAMLGNEGADTDDGADAATDEANADDEGPGPILSALLTGLDVAHLVLPKTGDAPLLTELVRQTLHSETRTLIGGVDLDRFTLQVYERADGTIVIVSPTGSESTFPDGRNSNIEIEGMRPVYLRVDTDDTIEAWSASPREARTALREREEAIENGEEVEELSWPPSWTSSVDVLAPDEIDFGMQDPDTFQRRRFVWSQPQLGFNPVFSFFSSVLASAVLVLLAIWRVRRIDF